jgi:hypothetical protein
VVIPQKGPFSTGSAVPVSNIANATNDDRILDPITYPRGLPALRRVYWPVYFLRACGARFIGN